MRLMYRYIVLAVSIVVAILLIVCWKLLERSQRIHLRDFGPRAIFYNPDIHGGSNAEKSVFKDSRIKFARGEKVPQHGNSHQEWMMYIGRQHNVNIYLSDFLPLNRKVPDSRPTGCPNIFPDDLPTLAVVITFHNEWPSLLFRTILSVVNRTPTQILQKVILIDDASESNGYIMELHKFILENLPDNLVKLVSLPIRSGLIRARLEGLKHIEDGIETVAFLDSHMEVNINWVQPLLIEVQKNRKTIAMAQLDYIESNSLKYTFTKGYRTRYGFDWRLHFFETQYRQDQLHGKLPTDPLPGVVMVGAAFIVDVNYFNEIGTYDSGMKIWGGENLELSWRVWLCGGQLIHVPCSRIGHIARDQPYTFLEDRQQVEVYNYKRATDVWLGNYSAYVYENYRDMKNYDIGNLSSRIHLKERLKCRPFSWFLENIWPELFAYNNDLPQSGGVGLKALQPPLCLDNNLYLFSAPEHLQISVCNFDHLRQNFALTADGRLRTTLQCVTVKQEDMDFIPYLQNCLEVNDKWRLTKAGLLHHTNTNLCLALLRKALIMTDCDVPKRSMKWAFHSEIKNL